MGMQTRWVAGLVAALTLMMAFTASAATPLTLPEPMAASKLGAPADSELGTRPDGIGLAPGAKMPAFTLANHEGATVTSEQLLKDGKRLLVVFYRGGWCPYCNLQIRQLTDAYSQFDANGVLPVLISADKVDASATVQRGYSIPFPVLSDPDLIAHDSFKVSMTMTPALYETYKTYGIDVEQWSGRDHHRFAVSSAFLVNTDGTVVWSHASLDYKQRPSIKQLLSVIAGKQSGK